MDVIPERQRVEHTDDLSAPGGLRTALQTVFLLFLASSYISIAVNSISLGFMALLWAALMVQEQRWLVRATPLDYVFLAYLLAELLSSALSVNPMQSLLFSRRILLIGIVYFIASMITEEKTLRRAVAVLLGTAVIVGILGTIRSLATSSATGDRLTIFQFYMTTSELMMIAGLFLLAFLLHAGTPPKIRFAALAGLLPVLFSLYATVTRGAYLGFLAAGLLIILARNRRLLIPFIVLVILVIIIAPPFVEQRIQSIVDLNHPENQSRLMIWTAGLRIVADHPLVGVGDIDLGGLLREYADPEYPDLWGHMHNVPLQYLVTLGILGFLVVAALFVLIAVNEWRAYRSTRNEWFLGSVSLGSLAVLLGLHVHGLTEWTFGDQEASVLFWTSVGFSLAAARLGGFPTTKRQGGTP